MSCHHDWGLAFLDSPQNFGNAVLKVSYPDGHCGYNCSCKARWRQTPEVRFEFGGLPGLPGRPLVSQFRTLRKPRALEFSCPRKQCSRRGPRRPPPTADYRHHPQGLISESWIHEDRNRLHQESDSQWIFEDRLELRVRENPPELVHEGSRSQSEALVHKPRPVRRSTSRHATALKKSRPR